MRCPSLYLALLILLPLSCKKGPPPEPESVPLPAELKSYTLFQPGTHWVYQDSATRRLDSVWVVSTEMTEVRQALRGETYPVFKYENFRMRTRSSRGGPDRVYEAKRDCALPGREDANNLGQCWYVRYGDYDPTSAAWVSGDDVFPYRINRDQPSYFNAPRAAYWHSQPLRIGEQVYPDVLEVNKYSGYYAWAPGVGIVRQRVQVNFVPHTRTLLRSRIVQ